MMGVKKVDTMMAILRIQAMIRARKKRKARGEEIEEKAREQAEMLQKTTAMLAEGKLAKQMRELKGGAKYGVDAPSEQQSSAAAPRAGWGKIKSAPTQDELQS